jgi:hypothetical protein
VCKQQGKRQTIGPEAQKRFSRRGSSKTRSKTDGRSVGINNNIPSDKNVSNIFGRPAPIRKNWIFPSRCTFHERLLVETFKYE